METDFKQTVCGIAGLGLIGGSIAKALKQKAKIKTVIAWNHKKSSIRDAVSDGAISEKSSTDIFCLKECDLIFICTPVGLVADTALKLYSIVPNAVITDVASTKASIMDMITQKAPDMRFIGGHPMAGSEKTGYCASDHNLFENAYYVLCKGESASQSDFELVKSLVVNMGGIPVIINPLVHDRAVSLISHLPHIAASSLSRLAGQNDDGFLSMLAAGGFRDVTRIASSSPELWTDIIKHNRDMIFKALSLYINELDTVRALLKNDDYDTLTKYLYDGRSFRDKLPQSGKGLIGKLPELRINVADKPGIIGEVATLLGEKGINIKNLHIQNSREYEGGVLRITISCDEDIEKTKSVLNNAGYKLEDE